MLDRKLKYDNNIKVLDVACGIGEIDFKLSSLYNVTIVGIDFSLKSVKYASKENEFYKDIINEVIHFSVGDAHNLPFKNNTFDFIISNCALEHFDDDQRVIKEMYRLLKDGGKLIITVDALQNGEPTISFLSKLPKGILKILLKDKIYESLVEGNSLSKALLDYRCYRFNVKQLYDEDCLKKLFIGNGFEIIELKSYLNSIFSVFFFELYIALKNLEFSNKFGRLLFSVVYPLCVFEPIKYRDLKYGLMVYAEKTKNLPREDFSFND